VVLIAGLCLILFLGGKDTAVVVDQQAASQAEPGAQATIEFDEETEYSYEGVDQSILEGMAGTDDSLFSPEDAEMADALFAEEGIRIGVTIGDIVTKNDEMLLRKLEEVSNIAEEEKIVYEVYYYNAGGDYNQQLQDVRSLIKNEVDVIIIGSTIKESFNMVASMAKQEGIPVVAYDAPITTGYDANVITDQAAWAKKYGEFMAENLAEGNVVQIGDENESDIEILRNAVILSALAKNQNITAIVKTYSKWRASQQNEALAALLEEYKTIDGVIIEEGMAEGLIDAYIAAAKKIEDITIETDLLPKVMCADATAGFIKTWYALKNGGVDVTPDMIDGKKTDDETPRVMLKSGYGEFVVCAQPAPVGMGAAAFEIALKLALGYELKSGPGVTYEFVVETFITDSNLSEYYERIKEQKDSYVISEMIPEQDIEALFNPTMTTE